LGERVKEMDVVTFSRLVNQRNGSLGLERRHGGRKATAMRFFTHLLTLLAISIFILFSVDAIGAAHSRQRAKNEGTPQTPVLVELFTSEGCSDCPPADAMLEKLDRSQPVRGAELIVLSEHVDYWDYIGWKDPYSSHAYSERQGAYGNRFGLSSVYTPQMVVDGRFEFVGSDERRAILAIENAAKLEKIPVSLSSVRLEGERTVALHVDAGALPASSPAKSASVLLAIADESDESHVSRGENAGRTLRHVAVLRNLTRIGNVDKSAGFSQDIKVDLDNGSSRNLRIAVIAQESPGGRIWGAGSARLSN